MTLQEILDKAIYVQFPFRKNTFKEYPEINEHQVHRFSTNETRYDGMKKNEHHFTTAYHYKYVTPKLLELLGYTFNENDFTLKKNIINENGVKYDLSYLMPKKDYKFSVTSFNHDITYNCSFDGLMFNNQVKGFTWITPYHKLYALPHECSRVKNKTLRNGRKLLISGDSQMIPEIPILACYFEEVWYFDNREDLSFKDILEKQNFTDVIFALYAGGGFDRYTKKILSNINKYLK